MKDKKWRIPKINSINFGARWIFIGFLIGAIIPLVVWMIFHVFIWIFCVLGGIILATFLIVFIIEMCQDNSKIPYYERNLKEKFPFDKEKEYAVIHSSICNGEKIVGFKSFSDSHFTEVMVIKKPSDLERFKKIYDITEIKTEY